MKSQKHYLLGFIVAALILILVGLVVIFGVEREKKDYAWVQHSYEVISQLDQIKAVKLEAISSQRAYLLTGKSEMRQQYWKSRERSIIKLNGLQTLVQDNTTQSARVLKLNKIIKRRLALAAVTIDINDVKGLPEAQAYILSNGSLAMDDTIDELGQIIRTEESRLLLLRNTSMQKSQRNLYFSAVLGIPVSLLILFVIYRLLRRENYQRELAESYSNKSNLELSDSVLRLEHVSKQMSLLTHYTGMLQSCNSSEDVLEISRQSWATMMPESAGSIYLVRASRDHAEIAVSWGQHRAPSNILPSPDDCWAMRRHQPYILRDLHNSVKCAHVEMPPGGLRTDTACVPLSAQGESMGWVYISAEAGKLPDESLLKSSAEQLSLALANLRLKEKLKQQSIRDPLTHLFNRRYLEESFERELARCKRKNLPLSLLMIDLDHFKKFNDTHGHPGGDALLSDFGRLLRSLCRREDIPCRYGGEEFVMLLPECDIECAKIRAVTINQATAELQVKHQNLDLARVTASIGLATFPDHGLDINGLIKAADAALYRAKALGRNRTELANIDL